MANKFAVANNSTIGDRLLLVGEAALQLSTGDLVMLVNDPSQADPNKVTLQLVTAHTTPSIITTLNYGTGGTFKTSTAAQAFALCRDASDNLYVIGCYQNYEYLAYQAFLKGSGLTWTPQAANTCLSHMTGSPNPFAFTAKWCNTGGGLNGLGHVIVFVQTDGVGTGCYILSAGGMLQGLAQYGTVITNPSCLGASSTTTCFGGNLSMDTDGFGATTGMVLSSNGTGSALLANFGVTSTGQLTGSGSGATLSTATLTATTKLRLVRFAQGAYAAVVPSAANAGQMTVSGVNPGFFNPLGTVDTGTASNFPAPSATLSWDIAASVGVLNEIWVYGWSSATATTMLRIPVSFANGTATVGATVSDDTSVGTGTNTTIRVVKSPVDWLHTDWQAYDTVSPYSLLGDYSALPTPPTAPTLLTPAAGTSAYLSAGGTFTWQHNASVAGDTQASFQFERQLSGSTVEYYNVSGASWSGTPTTNTSTTQAVTFPSGKWAASSTYTWSVQTVGTLTGLSSGFAPPQYVFSSAALPSTPTLTVTYDSTNNRAQIVAAGTGTDQLQVESSDDGGTTWVFIRASPVTLVSGAATFYDYEAPPYAARLYRAAQIDLSQGVYAILGLWSTDPTDTVTTVPVLFWLRDPLALTAGLNPHIQKGSFTTQQNENLTVYNPMGRQYPVILSDVLNGEDGAATFMTYNLTDENALRTMLQEQSILLLQAPSGQQWYIRRTSPIPTANRGVERQGNYKEWAITWSTMGRP